MRTFEMKIKRIKDKYTIRESKEPEGRKTHILYHETETPHERNKVLGDLCLEQVTE